MIGERTTSDTGSGDRLLRWAYAGFSFPVGWLALVAAVALIAGVPLALLEPGPSEEANGSLGSLVLLGDVATGLLLGVVAGMLGLRPWRSAWMGAAVWSVAVSSSALVTWYRGSVPEEEAGGLGLLIGAVFALTIGPLFAGALLGHGLRRAPLATTAVLFGGLAFVTCLAWLTLKLMNLS